MSRIPLRTRVRDSALKLVGMAGGLRLTGNTRWRSRRLLILCYHGFSLDDEHRWNPQLYIPAAHLERRLALLDSEGYRVLPLAEAMTRLTAGTLPPKAIVITIDDGTHDFHAVAYPIFQRHQIPVTLYVTTYYVFDPRPVFDVAASYLLWKATSTKSVTLADPRTSQPARLDTAAAAQGFFGRLRATASEQRWTATDKHEWLVRFAGEVGLDWSGFVNRRQLALMHPEEVGALDSRIVDVQLHTHRHRVPEARELFLRELVDNRRALSECGVAADQLTHFCYPSGLHRPAFLPWLREAGIQTAVTCVPSLASASSNPLLLPRFIDGSNTADVEFEAWLSGFRHIARRPTRFFTVEG